MDFAGPLGIRPGVTAVIGGGGKTTLLRTLGTELAADGARVLLCTTTKIFPFDGLPNLTDPTEDYLAQALEARRLVRVQSHGGALHTLAERCRGGGSDAL